MATSIVEDGFRSEADNLKYLAAIMGEYGIFHKEISSLSLVGLNAHMLNDMNEAVLNRSNIAIRESSVITARRLSSLYKLAREVDLFPTFAQPAVASFVLVISEKDFMHHATVSGDVASYVVSKDNFLTVGGYTYSFDYDFEIRLETGPKKEKYLTARYIKDTFENPISKRVNLTIKATMQLMPDGDNLFQIYMEKIMQYHREYVEKSVTHREYSSYNIRSKRVVDEIAGIDIFHLGRGANNAGNVTRLEKKMYFENSRQDTDSIFLNMRSANEFDIIHKSEQSGFRPLVGDTFQCVLYMTTGSGGNFTYGALQSRDIKFNYIDSNSLYMKPILIGDGISSGGVSFGINKETLRRQIITKNSTRDSINIENDLYMILNNISSQVGSTNEYAVVKNRNDIIKVFNIYTSLHFIDTKSVTRYTVPTNTLNTKWNLTTHAKEIDAGSGWYMMDGYNATSDSIAKGEVRKESELAGLSDNHLKYRIPFIVSYDRNKNQVRLYENYVKSRHWCDYNLIYGKMPYTFNCNWVKLTKNDINEAYEVNFEIRHTLAGKFEPKEKFYELLDHPTIPGRKVLKDSNLLKVFFVIKDSNDVELFRRKVTMKTHVVNGDDSYFTYSFNLIEANEEIIIKEDKILLKDDAGVTSYIPIEKLKGAIEVSMPTARSANSDTFDIDDKLINRFSFDCDLVNNRSKEFKIQHDVIAGVNDELLIYHLPVVENEFYKEHKEIFRDALISEYLMGYYISKYQGEFSYSIKFMNTYGYSNIYTVGIDKKPLDNVMLDFDFYLYKLPGSTIQEKDLSRAVSEYLTSIKFLSYDEFHVSNLYDYLYKSFPADIKSIQFKGFNKYNESNQLISMNISEIGNDTIVEKLNIPIIYDTESGTFHNKIKWTFL